MNKKVYSLLLSVMTLSVLLTGCKSDEAITFDHERQQFETRSDRILLEYIAPFGTTANEEVYIIGPFNGNSLVANAEGRFEMPVLDEAYRLTKAEKSNAKWGIYLDPSVFQDGRTLGDGFRFYSVTQGNESLLGDSAVYAVHRDNPGIGTFTNVWGQRWESYYWGSEGPETEHDGFVVYVIDETGWDTHLYQWGDVNNLNGDWPGAAPTGVQSINGVQYKYWDMGEANTGLSQHLIFNDGGAGQQLADFDYVIDHDVYLRITTEGVEEITAGPSHDGYAVFVVNITTWDAITLYQWGDVNNLNGDWPGAEPTGTQVVGGIEFTYWDMGEANTGLNQNLIFNNNGGGIQLADFAYTIDHDVYLEVSDAGVKEIDPYSYGGQQTTDNGQQTTDEKVIIAVKNSVGYADPHLYVWGDSEACGGWPGSAPVKVTDNGWYLFELPAGGTFNLILNDNGSPQVDGPAVLTSGSYFFDVNSVWEESPNRVTIENGGIYADPCLYAWGAGEIYGGWRGIRPSSNENGTLVFPLPNDGGEYNLILNGDGGVQQDIATVTANRSYTFTAN